MKEVIN